jgi:hypothetical protein
MMSCEGAVELREITDFLNVLCVSPPKRNSIPAPRNSTILRLYSASSEKGPDASTCATLDPPAERIAVSRHAGRFVGHAAAVLPGRRYTGRFGDDLQLGILRTGIQ